MMKFEPFILEYILVDCLDTYKKNLYYFPPLLITGMVVVIEGIKKLFNC